MMAIMLTTPNSFDKTCLLKTTILCNPSKKSASVKDKIHSLYHSAYLKRPFS